MLGIKIKNTRDVVLSEMWHWARRAISINVLALLNKYWRPVTVSGLYDVTQLKCDFEYILGDGHAW